MLKYHIVWCVKYRHPILICCVEESVKNILVDIALDNDIKIIEMETDKDHVHLLVECNPQHYIPNIIKSFKGISSSMLCS